MAIRLIGSFRKPIYGRFIVPPLETEIEDNDWWLVAEMKQREEDRGSIVDPSGASDDWGTLPPVQ